MKIFNSGKSAMPGATVLPILRSRNNQRVFRQRSATVEFTFLHQFRQQRSIPIFYSPDK
jgi:hypothetical protein